MHFEAETHLDKDVRGRHAADQVRHHANSGLDGLFCSFDDDVAQLVLASRIVHLDMGVGCCHQCPDDVAAGADDAAHRALWALKHIASDAWIGAVALLQRVLRSIRTVRCEKG